MKLKQMKVTINNKAIMNKLIKIMSKIIPLLIMTIIVIKMTNKKKLKTIKK